MTDETSTTFPVFDDERTGADHAVIKVKSGDLNVEALGAVLGALSKSRVPVTVVLAQDGPPPLYLTVAETARSLGVPRGHVEAMIRTRWLRPVYWQGDDVAPGTRMSSMQVAEETGDYRGWPKLIPWADVVELADHALKIGHLPSIARPKPGMRLWKEPPERTARKYGVAQVARKVLMDAKDPDTGEQLWMSGPAIFEAVERFIHTKRPSQPVKFNTVRAAIASTGVRKGFVEGRPIGWRRDDPQAKMEYRWKGDPDLVPREGHVTIVNVSSGHRLTDDEKAKMAAEYAAGRSSTELAPEYGVTPVTVRYWARKAGVPIRKGGGWFPPTKPEETAE